MVDESKKEEALEASPKDNRKIIIIVAVIIGVLVLCMCACSAFFYFSSKSVENGVYEYNDQILPYNGGLGGDFGSTDGSMIADGEGGMMVDEFITFGEQSGNEDWVLKVTGARKVGSTVIVKMEVTNITSEPRTLSSLLSLDLKNKNLVYDEYDKGYIQDFFTETDRGLIDKEVPAGATFTGELPFSIDDGSDIDVLYLEFTPNFISGVHYNFELE